MQFDFVVAVVRNFNVLLFWMFFLVIYEFVDGVTVM